MLYLVTGLRNRELVSIAWENVSLSSREIFIPDTKSGRSFTVKLSPAAVEILRNIPHPEESPWVFPGPNPKRHVAQFPRKAWNRVRERAGMPDLHIHDLRRTFGSWLATQGTPLKTIAILLNQSSQSITDTVYAHLADAPIREATGSVGDNILSFTKIKKETA